VNVSYWLPRSLYDMQLVICSFTYNCVIGQLVF
jgi:hypothetical protein